MARIILIVAFLVTCALVFFTYDTASKKKSITEELVQTKNTLSSTQARLAQTAKDLEATQKAKEELESQLAATKSELETSKESLAKTQTQVSELQASLKTAEDARTAAEEKFAKFEQAFPGRTPEEAASELTQFQKDIEDLNNNIKETEDRLTAAQAQIAKYQSEEEMRRKGVSPPGINGKIVAINTQWNFVVLDVGKESGVVENSELTVLRGNQPIAKVKVVQVDANTCVADLTKVVRNARPGIGDRVISN